MTTFRAQIANWNRRTKEELDAIARQTSQAMGQKVVYATPVDTGFLRGSWQPSIGEPINADGSPDPGGGTTVAKVAVVAAQVISGQTFYMMNNAKYAGFVEHGTSKMAGRHYVLGTVKQWPKVVNEVLAELKIK